MRNVPLRFDPPTDDDPYFFNILRLGDITRCFSVPSQGAMAGNLVATASLAGLILGLSIMAVATVLVPLLLRGRIGEVDGKGDWDLLCEAPGGPFRQKVPVPFPPQGRKSSGPAPPISPSSAPASCSWKSP